MLTTIKWYKYTYLLNETGRGYSILGTLYQHFYGLKKFGKLSYMHFVLLFIEVVF